MKLQEAQELAIQLMKKHNLLNCGWKFKFDSAKRRLGSCSDWSSTITLSKDIVLVNDIDVIKNTILHEIAHALVGCRQGHNEIWKRKALEIGCNGNRVCRNGVKVEGKYVAECDGCGKTYYIHRVKKHHSSCGSCSGGTYNYLFKLNFKLNLEYQK